MVRCGYSSQSQLLSACSSGCTCDLPQPVWLGGRLFPSEAQQWWHPSQPKHHLDQAGHTASIIIMHKAK